MTFYEWLHKTDRVSETGKAICLHHIGTQSYRETAYALKYTAPWVRSVVRGAKFKFDNRNNTSPNRKEFEVKRIARQSAGSKRKVVMTISEDVIHISILKYLDTVLPKDATPAWHTPNGGKRDRGTARKMKALGTRAGFPDLAFLWQGNLYTLEIKPVGKYQTPDQKDWEGFIVKAGGFYAVAHSIDETKAQLQEWGIIK